VSASRRVGSIAVIERADGTSGDEKTDVGTSDGGTNRKSVLTSFSFRTRSACEPRENEKEKAEIPVINGKVVGPESITSKISTPHIHIEVVSVCASKCKSSVFVQCQH